jgi:hypothetical protein
MIENKTLDLPSMKMGIEQEDAKDFFMEKGLGDAAADILSASRQTIPLETQIAAHRQLQREGKDMKQNNLAADARLLLGDYYGEERAEDILRTFDGQSVANLVLSIARKIDTQPLTLPVMNGGK